jgi:hypothetical protein
MTIPVGFAQITHKISVADNGRAAYVVYGVANPTDMDAASVALAADAAWSANLAKAMTTEGITNETLAKLGPDASGPSAQVAVEGGTGVEIPPTCTPQVAYLISKNTALGGRRGRGRMYIPAVKEESVSVLGRLDTGITSRISAKLGPFLVALTTDDIPMVLLHDPPTRWDLVDGQPRRVPTSGSIPAPTPVLNLSLSPVVATQRRRNR